MKFNTLRAFPSFLLIAAFAQAQGQDRAQACFFSADFEDGLIPAGWDIGPLVERQTSEGDSLDEFVPAWTVGTTAQANTNGYFPVVDIPTGNQFAMANDDAAPCNCTMADVHLTTPVIDLTLRNNVSLECRVFHEMILGSGHGLIEATINGSDWIVLDTLDAVAGDWKNVFLDLSDYSGEALFQLRFRWSDGGTWSSGFAVDDVCLRERYPIDVSLVQLSFGDRTISPFIVGGQDLRYSAIPLAQAGPIAVSVELVNRGTSTLQGVVAVLDLELNGTSQGSYSAPGGSNLGPGERDTIVIATGWTPNAIGLLEATVHLDAVDLEDDTSDNLGITRMLITGPGWENGYGAMACDEGVMQGAVGGSNNFIAANRMEIVNEGSAARGISGVITGNSQVGELVRAILMDATFTFVDTSLRHTLTQTDLDNGWVGEALYLPLSTTPTLSPGDYHVGMQRLTGTGEVFVATSGNGPIGASVLMEGTSFDITYLTGTPMVRLHLEDYGVGIAEQDHAVTQMHLYPVPANDLVALRFELATAARVRIEVADLMGRRVLSQEVGSLPAGEYTQRLSIGALAAGSYTVRLLTDEYGSEQQLIIAR